MGVESGQEQRGSPKRKLSQSGLATKIDGSPQRRRKQNTPVSKDLSTVPKSSSETTPNETRAVLQPPSGSVTVEHSQDAAADDHSTKDSPTDCTSWEASLEKLRGEDGDTNIGVAKSLEGDIAELESHNSGEATRDCSSLDVAKNDSRKHDTCHDTWEPQFEHLKKADQFLTTLAACVETRRSMFDWQARVSHYEQIAAVLTNGHNGLTESEQRAAELHAKTMGRDRIELDAIEDRLGKLKQQIERAQQQQDDATIETNQEFATLVRRARDIYALADEVDIREHLTLWMLPEPFFEQFDRCLELETQCTELQREKLSLQAKQIDKRDEIQVVLARVFEVRSLGVSGREADISLLEDQIQQLRESPELLAIDKDDQWYTAELDAVEGEQSRAENAMYQTLERHLSAKDLLQERITTNLDPINSPRDLSRLGSKVCCTPVEGIIESPSDTEDFAKQLTERLSRTLKANYHTARRYLERCQNRLDELRNVDDLDWAEHALAESPDHALFLAKSQRTRDVREAESTFEEILERARDAGIPGLPAKSTGFSDHASDGYSAATVEAHFKLTDKFGIEKWIDSETSSKARVMFAQSDIVQMLEPSEPEVDERADLESLALGESYSTVAAGKNKARIDGWLAVQKPRVIPGNEQDGTKRSKRRMSI